MLGIFLFCFFADFFFKSTFSKNSLGITMKDSKSFDPDQARHFVGSDLDPNSLQRSSDDSSSWQRINLLTHSNYGICQLMKLSKVPKLHIVAICHICMMCWMLNLSLVISRENITYWILGFIKQYRVPNMTPAGDTTWTLDMSCELSAGGRLAWYIKCYLIFQRRCKIGKCVCKL